MNDDEAKQLLEYLTDSTPEFPRGLPPEVLVEVLWGHAKAQTERSNLMAQILLDLWEKHGKTSAFANALSDAVSKNSRNIQDGMNYLDREIAKLRDGEDPPMDRPRFSLN